jgi:hypothetical protein
MLYYFIVLLVIIFSTILIKFNVDKTAYDSALQFFSISWSSIFDEFSIDFASSLNKNILDLPLGEVTSVLSGNLFNISDKLVSLEGVLSIKPNTPQYGIARDKLERLILRKKVKYDIKSIDEHKNIVAQVWIENANVNSIMIEYIKSLSKRPVTKYITN